MPIIHNVLLYHVKRNGDGRASNPFLHNVQNGLYHRLYRFHINVYMIHR